MMGVWLWMELLRGGREQVGHQNWGKGEGVCLLLVHLGWSHIFGNPGISQIAKENLPPAPAPPRILILAVFKYNCQATPERQQS